jgi:ribose 5-phosphate isomerase B
MIYLGADHRGFQLKEKIKNWLAEGNYEFEDLGNDRFDPEDDYPDFAKKVAKKLGRSDKGIVICGSGVGVDIVANRFPELRCGLGFLPEQIKKAREDDDINCLALAADFLEEKVAKEIIKTFLETPFSSQENKIRRLKKIE